MKSKTADAMKHLANQREYVKEKAIEAQRGAAGASQGRSGLVDERMLAESMRSVRYEDEAHAAADLIDNSIEAGASNVHLAFKTEGDRITEIAFVDDGSGIVPEFLPHATKWGGSSNQGERNVFGRFGFGLPSASVNRARAYDVRSRTQGDEPFSGVTVDLDNLVDENGVVPLPTVSERGLPGWLVKYLDESFEGGVGAVRTVVVWRNIDRLAWKNRQKASSNFRQHFGVTYAGWLDVVKIVVNGDAVEPVDVLFSTPGYRWHDIEGYPSAEGQNNIVLDIKDKDGTPHQVTVRFSYISSEAWDAKVAPDGRGNHKRIRLDIRKKYNGVFVTRHGRFIELVQWPELTWNNYARQVGMALDFSPELDELFGVTPDKQTVTFSESVSDALVGAGVVRAFKALVASVTNERETNKAERGGLLDPDGPTDAPRPSETVIAKVVEKDIKKRKPSEETIEEGERNWKRRIKEIAASTGMDEAEVEKAQEKVQRTRPYRVAFERRLESDPFFQPYMENVQTVLEINTAHPWFTELYSKLTPSQAEVRSGLELFLFVLGVRELESTGENKVFYRSERRLWSDLLANAFDLHPEVFHAVPSSELEDLDNRAWEEEPSDMTEAETEGV